MAEELRDILNIAGGLLNQYEPRREQCWPVAPSSTLAGDDAQCDPYHLSHSVQHAINVAMDHVQCLYSSMIRQTTTDQTYVQLNTHGQATLLRCVLENSARAVWLLAPSQRLERIRRRLALQNDDHRNNRAMTKIMLAASQNPADPDTFYARSEEAQHDQLTSLLRAAGAAYPSPKDWKAALRFPTYAEVVREAGRLLPQPSGVADPLDMGSLLEMAWRGCSALAHGDLSGTLSQLNREVTSEDGNNMFIRLTGSAENILLWTQLAGLTVTKAANLFEERSTS